MNFKRGKDPKEAMGIGYLQMIRDNKMKAIKEENYEKASFWRTKERSFLKLPKITTK